MRPSRRARPRSTRACWRSFPVRGNLYHRAVTRLGDPHRSGASPQPDRGTATTAQSPVNVRMYLSIVKKRPARAQVRAGPGARGLREGSVRFRGGALERERLARRVRLFEDGRGEISQKPSGAKAPLVTKPSSPGYRSGRSSTLQEGRAIPPQRPDTSLPTEMGTVSLRSYGE